MPKTAFVTIAGRTNAGKSSLVTYGRIDTEIVNNA